MDLWLIWLEVTIDFKFKSLDKTDLWLIIELWLIYGLMIDFGEL